MREILRSNDWVRISWATALLADSGIETLLLDGHIAAVEGSISAFERRLMVDDASWWRARRLLDEAEAAIARE
jgi:hypothetical protein